VMAASSAAIIPSLRQCVRGVLCGLVIYLLV